MLGEFDAAILWAAIFSIAACGHAPPPPHAPATTVADPVRWFSERGATPSDFDGTDCHQIAVGPPHEPALLCTQVRSGGTEQPPGAWIDTRRIASVVRAGKIASVLDVGVSLQGDDSGLPRLILQLDFAADGTSATLIDRNVVAPSDPTKGPQVAPDEGCDSDPEDVLLRRLCAGRGTFRWSGGRYVRVP